MNFFYPAEYNRFNYNPSSLYDSFSDSYEPTPNETRYRRLAEEHERRALAALALAEQEERRRRQSSFNRFQPDDFYSHPPSYYNSTRRPHFAPEQHTREEHERQIEEWLQRRRQREQEEEDQRRRRYQERQNEEDVIRQLLQGFGLDRRDAPSSRRTAQSLEQEATRPACSTCQHHHKEAEPTRGRSQPPRAVRAPQQVQAPQPSTSQPSDLPSRIWAALSGGRSDAEKSQILSELGLTAPRTAPTQQPTSRPSIPIVITSASTPAPTPKPTATGTTTSKSSTFAPKTPSTPTPTRLSPFAHIESIQVKFDASRATFSSTSDASVYEFELNKLLAMLDEVESSGAESVRGARKALVRAVEEELEELERKKGVKEEAAKAVADGKDEAAEAQSVPPETSMAEVYVEEAAAPMDEEVKPVQEAEPIEVDVQPEAGATASSTEALTSTDTAEQPQAPPSPAPAPIITEPTSKTASVADTESRSSSPARGRSPSKHDVKKEKKRPASVEIEEVPDEGDVASPRSAGFEIVH